MLDKYLSTLARVSQLWIGILTLGLVVWRLFWLADSCLDPSVNIALLTTSSSCHWGLVYRSRVGHGHSLDFSRQYFPRRDGHKALPVVWFFFARQKIFVRHIEKRTQLAWAHVGCFSREIAEAWNGIRGFQRWICRPIFVYTVRWTSWRCTAKLVSWTNPVLYFAGYLEGAALSRSMLLQNLGEVLAELDIAEIRV